MHLSSFPNGLGKKGRGNKYITEKQTSASQRNTLKTELNKLKTDASRQITIRKN